jgi:tetratricopeptide (TPR) repeat protein
LLLPAYAALERHDAVAAVLPLQTFWKAWLADPNLQYTYNTQPCLLGLAYGLTGRMAEAEAVFKRTGNWALCTALHGDVLEDAGDLAGAERIWAEGLRLGPDLSPVYLHRGISEMNRGDFAHAGADLATATNKSPHWADTWKAWGDLLVREHRSKQALAKYDEALKYAPAWAALHEARRAAAAHR